MVNFPIWDLPYTGGGLLIAVVAVVHVFVSHFAIGGGLFLVLTERKAYRDVDAGMLAYVRRSALVFILITLVLGALTGVGIWFTIGLISPSATSALIHIFVWAWAIEWVFFLVEIAAAFIYYYSWGRLDRRTHMAVGWIYFASAWLSLFVINGILSFMLTPGKWLESRSIVDGLFNPTFWPSLFLRTMVALALAGLYGLVTACFLEPMELRHKMTRWAGKWLWPPFVLMPLCGVWFLLRVPDFARHNALAAPVALLLMGSVLLSLLIFAFSVFGPVKKPEALSLPFAILIVVLGLAVTGTSEWVREAVRKPYIISNYMYGNEILVSSRGALDRMGVLASARWALARDLQEGREYSAGREIFRIQCQTCHTVDGYNGIRPLVRNWDQEFIHYQLQHLETLKGYMPPFMGTEAERRALAGYLAGLSR